MNQKAMAEAVALARRIKRVIWPRYGEALFWSGRKEVLGLKSLVTVRPDAQKYAKTHNLKISSQSFLDAGIWIPHRTRNPLSNRLWYFASVTYARRASGIIRAIVDEKSQQHLGECRDPTPTEEPQRQEDC